ncbi:hypothetical protein C8A05DRAFT_30640 [Staphylotrichum tortipilum]|uniref:Uncharacterized protein n=1 Tax=Staphylotrichum tortipilum TaxID=2831512 RepID=A0AAN6RWP0_9PEZI|nr:hypothetical protein C8A05DRAFT_30640 [Staphylotrichum longicolle]
MADSGSKNYEWKWFCSNCSDGPLSRLYDAYCPSCQHKRCGSCTIVKFVYKG